MTNPLKHKLFQLLLISKRWHTYHIMMCVDDPPPHSFQHSSVNSSNFQFGKIYNKAGQMFPNVIIVPACGPEDLQVQSHIKPLLSINSF